MSAQVQAVGFLCLLAVAAGGVTVSVLPSVTRRARQMQAAQQKREHEAREIVEASSSSRFAQELTAHGSHGEPNYTRTSECALVERPPGDTQEWQIQERVVGPDPVDVVPPAPEVPLWMTQVALDDEPTPLAPGPVPQLGEFESFTDTWTRAELLARIREGEYELAKGDQAA